MTPPTSPSPISMMRGAGLAHLGDQLGMARPVEDADDEVGDLDLLGLREVLQVGGRRLVEIDDAVRQAAADRDLVHVDVGRVEETAGIGHGHHGERVGAALGGDRRAFERIERDVDLAARGRCRPSRRYRASAPRRARPRRSRRCRRSPALLSAWRIASTAAWSAAFSSPRPISREADSAAASVTRTASSARLRSIFELLAASSPSLV